MVLVHLVQSAHVSGARNGCAVVLCYCLRIEHEGCYKQGLVAQHAPAHHQQNSEALLPHDAAPAVAHACPVAAAVLQQRDHEEFVVRLKDVISDKQQLLRDLEDNAAKHYDLQVGL